MEMYDKHQILFIFKYINKSLKILIKLNSYSFFFEDIFLAHRIITGNRKRIYLPQNPSPDSSGKPMPVENHFFLVLAERPKKAPDSG